MTCRDRQVKVRLLNNIAGNHGNQWQKVILCLAVGMYGLAFVGTIGEHGQSDIAIDNVDLSYDPTVCYDTSPLNAASGLYCWVYNKCLVTSIRLLLT